MGGFESFQCFSNYSRIRDIIHVKNTVKRLAFSTMVRVARAVAWVNYPGLKSSKYYDLAQEYLPKGQNGLVV
jgi:O-acetylhomoserine (thiol)-lyase